MTDPVIDQDRLNQIIVDHIFGYEIPKPDRDIFKDSHRTFHITTHDITLMITAYLTNTPQDDSAPVPALQP